MQQIMLRWRVGCLRQPTLPLSIRINTGSLYRNVSILNYKRDKDNVSYIILKLLCNFPAYNDRLRS